MKPKLTVLDDDGNNVELPSKFAVCGRCGGSGVHDHPAFSNGISQEQFDEDPDFREEYLAGRYDVPCSECKGERVVSVPDEERLNPDQKRWLAAHYEYLSDLAAERRMRERGIEF